MKRTVKGTKIIMRIDAHNEFMNEYVDIFKPYFNKVAHHHKVDHSINKDAVLAYSYFPCDVSCSGCHQKAMGISIPQIDGSFPIREGFYDSNFKNIPCTRLIQVLYGGAVFGYYCVKNNIFTTTDFAHKNGNQPHVAAIFEYMYKSGIFPLVETTNENTQVTLGTDPEMEATVQGEFVAANRLPSMHLWDKQYISADGARNQREIRPDPASSPEELVENIRDLIKISSFFGEDLSVAGKLYPLGGHIHIGGTGPSTELIHLLDYFLSPFNQFNSNERNDSKYGKPGDFRYQPHGFEYRTPPAAWLLSPILALKTLQLTKVVVEHLINGKDVVISDTNDADEYKENLKQFPICTDEWIEEFIDEIEWAKHNLDAPLAKTWGVYIPKQFQVNKKYMHEPAINESIQSPAVRIWEMPEDTNVFTYNEDHREIDPETGEPYE